MPRAVHRGAVLVAAVLAMLGTMSWVAPPAVAQQSERGALMVVMDGSGSMLAGDGTGRSKLDGAKAALRAVVAGLPDGAVTGLVDIAGRAARSYQQQGSKITGGAAHQDAPVLAPGTYSDTILAKEQLWYAVDLAVGQELTATSTLVVDDKDFGGAGSLYEVQLVGPDLDDLCCSRTRGCAGAGQR